MDLVDAKDYLESCQAGLDTVTSSLVEVQLELENARDALVNSERARQTVNLDRVLPRPRREQEVFVVLRFQQPQPLPVGGYHLSILWRKVMDRILSQLIADNSELDAAVVEELRFDRSPRSQSTETNYHPGQYPKFEEIEARLQSMTMEIRSINNTLKDVIVEFTPVPDILFMVNAFRTQLQSFKTSAETVESSLEGIVMTHNQQLANLQSRTNSTSFPPPLSTAGPLSASPSSHNR